MLEAIGKFNEFSPALRKQLDEAKAAAGKIVKYKFFIKHKNPDGERRADGEFIYPSLYTLSPVTFSIRDAGDNKMKRVGIVNEINAKGEPDGFKRIVIKEAWAGSYSINLENEEDAAIFEFLELHPKNETGAFRDKEIPAMFARVDELKDARARLTVRNKRADSLVVAANMRTEEIRDFAAAMNWDESQELEILKDKVFDVADKDPDFFERFINDKSIEFKAIIRRALDSNIIAWLPVESKFTWVTTGQTIAVMPMSAGDKFMSDFSDWLITHKNGPETFKKLKGLLSGK